jgi:prepilin-type N-terminal cleavage/methylation domain-containing protein
MKTRLKIKRDKPLGFTMVEVIIVLAIMGVIASIIFIAVPQALASRRDSERQAYARQVVQGMLEYYKNNGKLLSLNDADNSWGRFLAEYMPDGKDPTSGLDHKMADPDDIDWVSGGVINPPNRNTVIYSDGVSHDILPDPGEVYIAMGHLCQNAHPDNSGIVLSDKFYFQTSTNSEHRSDVFSVVTYQEHGAFYCIDNFDQQPNT